ncbi:MAG: hypothetical protein NXI32_09935 [bacterium]|nr:hypothetical protein [bacterium]
MKRKKQASRSVSAGRSARITPTTSERPQVRSRSAVWPAYASAALLWASFPPLGLAWLAWFAPLGWLHFVQTSRDLSRRDYLHLWFSGCLFWLAVLQGIRLAYWPLYLGWFALALYLAIYIPLFVAGARRLRGRGFPVMLSVPIVWIALEFARSYFLTGYAANLLAHTQVFYPLVIQLADQLGAYGISFLMMLTCAALSNWLQNSRRTADAKPWWPNLPSWRGLAIAAVMLAISLGYGWYRIGETEQLRKSRESLLSVLLVQENTPSMFDADVNTPKIAWSRYLETTRDLISRYGTPELVVWPESTFTAGSPWIAGELPARLPAEMRDRAMDRQIVENWLRGTRQEFAYKAQLLLEAASQTGPEDTDLQRDSLGQLASSPVPSSTNSVANNTQATLESPPDNGTPRSTQAPFLLVGSDAWEITSEKWKRFNSALFIGPDGNLKERYDKMHLVMFGEYIPLGPLLQWLRDMFGISGVEAGTAPVVLNLGDVRISPSICFETMMPRLIRRQVAWLTADGQSPHVLINITNDSWFRGSSMLDHHLACSILCAVENRRPLLVAANTGLSAEIDGAGRVQQVTERFAADGILARPHPDGRWGLVQSAGYPLAWICLFMSLLACLPRSRKRSDKAKIPPS